MYFYRNLFATLCFAFFALALATHAPWAYFAALLCGALSRTAVRKKWPEPPFRGPLFRLFGGDPPETEEEEGKTPEEADETGEGEEKAPGGTRAEPEGPPPREERPGN
jgi:hypothetical protein